MNLRFLAAAALLAVVASACKGRSAEEKTVSEPSAGPSWTAYKNGKPVLSFTRSSGTLGTGAALPPGGAPAQHPWLNAQPLDPLEEDALRGVLERSSGFDDFVANLKAAGYEIRQEAAK